MNPSVSIIIRTRNEAEWLGETLRRLRSQTYQDFEVIVVDSESTDATVAIAQSYNVRVVPIKAADFTYPYAINVGIAAARASQYYVILSAHSLPIGKNWLTAGIACFDREEPVLGVYGPLRALPGSTIWDRLVHDTSYCLEFILSLPYGQRTVRSTGAGVMGFTNAIIPKALYEQYPINEAFAAGGEDGDWATHWFAQGYVAVKSFRFAVRHSHNLDFAGWREQIAHWKSLNQPQTFSYLSYRKDPAHKQSE